jgi:hypothetical protein
MQFLAPFDFELQHIPSKHHILANFLSQPFGVDQGKDDNEEMVLLPPERFAQTKFPDELKQQREILKLYHNHPLAGHPGIANMTHLLAQSYEGEGMKEFTADYVRGCTTCQENKLHTTHRKAPLQLITTDPQSGPFQLVAMVWHPSKDCQQL